MPMMFPGPGEKQQVLNGIVTAVVRDWGTEPGLSRNMDTTAHVRAGDRAFAVLTIVDVRPFRPGDITDMQLRDLGLETKGQLKSYLRRRFGPKSKLADGDQGWIVKFRVKERDPGTDE
jgi:hypothetical protein